MRNACSVLIAATLFAVPMASAQTTNLVSGQISQYIATNATQGKCYIGRGPSTFQRTGAATKAYITFDELWYSGRYDLSGQADLIFTSATSGTIHFKYLPSQLAALPQPRFTGYSQNYNSTGKRLSIIFYVALADCTLRVAATYDGA